MLEVICLDSNGDSISCFNQWDSYQKIIIDGMNFTTAPQVHFCNEKSDMAIRVQSNLLEDGKIEADVPNSLLLEPLKIIIYIYTLSNNNGHTSGRTVQIAEIPVRSRLKPDNFEFKENVHVVYLEDLIDEVKELNITFTDAEKVRNDAEEIRKTNELERQSNESVRITSEENRINNESERISKFNELVVNTEQLITDTETAKLDAINTTLKANEATESAMSASQKATESAENADIATSAAISATDNANLATQEALNAKESANSAANNANDITEEIQNKAVNGDFSATVDIGEVATGLPGTSVKVENVGTLKDAVLNFTIPMGETGKIENIDEAIVEFEEFETGENITSGDSLGVLFGKIQKLFSDIPNVINTAILNTYPVGSIYTNVSNINPSTFIGGEWIPWGSGRVPVGVDVNDTAFSEVEATGGEKVHTLTSNEIPSHAHSISEKSYTSGINSVNHTHGIGAHSHGLNNHTHTTNSFSVASATESVNHTHNFSVNTSDTSKTLTGTFKALQWQTGTASGIVTQGTNKTDRAASAGTQMGHNTFTVDATHHHLVSGTTGGISANHNHSVTIPATTSNGPSTATTANSAQFNSGNQSENHTHNITISAHNTNSTGSGNAHNNLQPYITCYMWKRVA